MQRELRCDIIVFVKHIKVSSSLTSARTKSGLGRLLALAHVTGSLVKSVPCVLQISEYNEVTLLRHDNVAGSNFFSSSFLTFFPCTYIYLSLYIFFFFFNISYVPGSREREKDKVREKETGRKGEKERGMENQKTFISLAREKVSITSMGIEAVDQVESG